MNPHVAVPVRAYIYLPSSYSHVRALYTNFQSWIWSSYYLKLRSNSVVHFNFHNFLASRFASFPLLTLLISKHSRASTDRRTLHICPFLLPSRAACFLSRILVWRLARKKESGTSDHRDSIQSLPNQQLPPKTSFSNHTLPLELKLKACGTRQHRGIT